MLEGKALYEEEIPFKLLPVGALVSEGDLIAMECLGEPAVNAINKIEGRFRNTGQVNLQVKLVVEVYRDQKLVDVLESEEVLVEAGKEGTLTTYFKPPDSANYMLLGHVIYMGKESTIREVYFNFENEEADQQDKQGEQGGQVGSNPLPVIIATSAIVATILGAAYVATKITKRRKS